MTINEIIKDFNRITGDSSVLALASNYIRLSTTTRGKERVEIVGFRRSHLEKSADLREWFTDWKNNDYRINSKLGLRLCRFALIYNECIWIASTTKTDIENAKKTTKENCGHGLEYVCESIHKVNYHATIQEDKKQSIDVYMKIGGKLTKVQCKCSIANSSVNI